MRAIFGAKFNAPSSPIFKQLGILKFLDIYELYTCLFMFNFINGGLPSPLLGIYQYQRDIHEHNTRHSTDPRTPSANSDILRKSFLYQGPKLWASLDGHLKDSRTKSLFKRRMKTNCIDNYWYELVYKMSNTWEYLTTANGLDKWAGINKTINAWPWMGYITPATRKQFWWPQPHNEVTDVSLCGHLGCA